MPRKKETFEAMREITRQKIEKTALSLFARKGLSVKVDEIAQAAGISRGLLYSHYESKDMLIIELVRQAMVISSQDFIDFSQNEGTVVAKIKHITDKMCHILSETPIGIDYFMFMLQVGMSGFPVPAEAWYSEKFPSPIESLTAILIQGQPEGFVVDGDPLQLSIVYWATIQGLCCFVLSGIPVSHVSPEPNMLNRILLKEDFI